MSEFNLLLQIFTLLYKTVLVAVCQNRKAKSWTESVKAKTPDVPVTSKFTVSRAWDQLVTDWSISISSTSLGPTCQLHHYHLALGPLLVQLHHLKGSLDVGVWHICKHKNNEWNDSLQAYRLISAGLARFSATGYQFRDDSRGNLSFCSCSWQIKQLKAPERQQVQSGKSILCNALHTTHSCQKALQWFIWLWDEFVQVWEDIASYFTLVTTARR